ncbi:MULTISPECIES: NAD(P)/FAD-dependent oxidoreductase [Streptomycetaceae]|uniref:Putative phytoene dehydrogenase (Phytoene desaturase) n=1 Tax=Streptantibioticus cattleyicolor (strain ATCC 35852 / DSM 46488 / JCM 4925 / NBRC 14057 / NRRL 8057) TaxID=1003195 RepID=F8K0L4_STREN|nr:MULTISPECIES: hypothetical protein [Streptomycetaceae]AEW97420.1 putative phytoene dehydrogenase (phytoene desaturase) [Streptantibioticus cattleyicolor NRRL 8057 = DSM 46488]MYS61863.1 hypothetical protein [Streptomyces sp. SID5468]CCB77743.1 putative Monooxygenase FAD-binding [Streptantibioticus cattleyicolor NRRL 8057 = DSM 46488]
MRQAVVLGSSIAGLLAARVLAEHTEDVAVLEPDDMAADGALRPGAPQGVQLHVLLDMGRIQLERWFPGLTAALVADGAVHAQGTEFHSYVDGALKVPVPGHEMIGATRPFIEHRIRRRVLALPNVRTVRGRADRLVLTGGRVTGVGYRTADGGRAELTADFVVDATGRASRLGAWLTEAGWPAPPVRRMPIDLGYATAYFRRGAELPGVKIAASVVSPPRPGEAQRDGNAMAEVEGGRWMVMIGAYADGRPGKDPDEFRDRLARAAAAPFRTVAAECEMLGDVAVHRTPDSRRREFTALDRFPGGLVAAGDAVAAFNPVYGQGMSSAALHASCLSAYLRSGAAPGEPALGYFRRIRVVVDAAWSLSTLGDLAQPHVPGPYPPGYRISQWYSTLLVRATVTDQETHRRFLDVVNMRAHPRLLSRPDTVWRVARALWSAPN